MKLNYLKYRNVGPYGNETQELDFRGKEATLWQIIGKNGTGKSSMIRILKIVLYQEYDGVLVSEIANQINKNGYIEANVDSKGHNWTIINEFSPNKVRVYKDGNEEPEDWGGFSDTKKRIVEEVVDMPYYIFNNAISLSLDDFKSFLSMKAEDSRNIRDRIFGFYVVNEMVALMKPKMNKYVSEIADFKSKIESVNESIKTSKEEYDDLKSKVEEGSKEKIDKLNAEITKLQEEVEGYIKQKEEFDVKVASIKLKTEYLKNFVRKNTLKEMEEKLDKLNTDIDTVEKDRDTKKEKKKELDIEKELITSKATLQRIDDLSVKINKYEDDTKKLSLEEDEIQERVNDLNQKVSNFLASEETIKSRDLLKVNANHLLDLNNKQWEILSSIDKGEKYLKELSLKKEEGDQKYNASCTIITDLKKKISAHEEGICSECGTDLTTDDHLKKLDAHKADLELEDKKNSTINGMLEKLKDTENASNKKVDSLKESLQTIFDSYSDIRVGVSGVSENFVSAKDILLIAIKGTTRDTVHQWNMDGFNSALGTVFIPNADRSIEIDKRELEEEKEKLEEKCEEIKDISESKLTDSASMSTLKEGIKEGITKEKLDETEFSLESVDEYDGKLSELSDEIEEYDTTIRNNEREIGETKAKVDTMKKEIKPDSEFGDLLKMDTTDIGSSLEKLDKEIDGENEGLEKLESSINDVNQKISDKGVTIKSLSSGEHIDTQLQSVQSIISKFEEELEKFNTDIEKSRTLVLFFDAVYYTLSDKGIKSYIMKDVVPSINAEIAKILELLGVPLTVMFDEEFHVHIHRFGQEVSLRTISTGQRKMTDCAILLSITIILRMKYQFNITFYDEILSSIDSDNRPILLEIIKSVCCKKLKLHTFVMNHDYIPSSYFDYVVKIVHKNNFSSMQIKTQDGYESQYLAVEESEAKEIVDNLMVETSA